MRLAPVRVAPVRFAPVRVAPVRFAPAEVLAVKVGPAQVRAVQERVREVGVVEVGPGQVRVHEQGAGGLGSVQVGAEDVRPDQVSVAECGLRQVLAAQVRPGSCRRGRDDRGPEHGDDLDAEEVAAAAHVTGRRQPRAGVGAGGRRGDEEVERLHRWRGATPIRRATEGPCVLLRAGSNSSQETSVEAPSSDDVAST